MDRALIDLYLAGGGRLTGAIEGLSAAELNALPVPGTWSIRQIIIHLLDSDLIASHRMKRIIAEDTPLLIGYDETRFAQQLFYEQMDAALVCRLFADNRAMTAAILTRLPDEAFARWGVHNQYGKLTLAQMIRSYVDHLPHHLKIVHQKRRLLGKPAARED